MDSAVSIGLRRQQRMVARGRAAWIRPAHRMLRGILSVTQAVPRASVRSRAAWSDAASARKSRPSPPGARRSHSAPRALRKPSSPPAATAGWQDRICSTSVVADRGRPMTSTAAGSPGPPCAASARRSGWRGRPGTRTWRGRGGRAWRGRSGGRAWRGRSGGRALRGRSGDRRAPRAAGSKAQRSARRASAASKWRIASPWSARSSQALPSARCTFSRASGCSSGSARAARIRASSGASPGVRRRQRARSCGCRPGRHRTTRPRRGSRRAGRARPGPEGRRRGRVGTCATPGSRAGGDQHDWERVWTWKRSMAGRSLRCHSNDPSGSSEPLAAPPRPAPCLKVGASRPWARRDLGQGSSD